MTAVAAKIFQPRCSCSRQLGCRQEEFESRIDQDNKFHMVARDMFQMRLCCINSVTNSTMYHVRITDIARVINDGQSIDTPLIVLKKEPPRYPTEKKAKQEQEVEDIPALED